MSMRYLSESTISTRTRWPSPTILEEEEEDSSSVGSPMFPFDEEPSLEDRVSSLSRLLQQKGEPSGGDSCDSNETINQSSLEDDDDDQMSSELKQLETSEELLRRELELFSNKQQSSAVATTSASPVSCCSSTGSVVFVAPEEIEANDPTARRRSKRSKPNDQEQQQPPRLLEATNNAQQSSSESWLSSLAPLKLPASLASILTSGRISTISPGNVPLSPLQQQSTIENEEPPLPLRRTLSADVVQPSTNQQVEPPLLGRKPLSLLRTVSDDPRNYSRDDISWPAAKQQQIAAHDGNGTCSLPSNIDNGAAVTAKEALLDEEKLPQQQPEGAKQAPLDEHIPQPDVVDILPSGDQLVLRPQHQLDSKPQQCSPSGALTPSQPESSALSVDMADDEEAEMMNMRVTSLLQGHLPSPPVSPAVSPAPDSPSSYNSDDGMSSISFWSLPNHTTTTSLASSSRKTRRSQSPDLDSTEKPEDQLPIITSFVASYYQRSPRLPDLGATDKPDSPRSSPQGSTQSSRSATSSIASVLSISSRKRRAPLPPMLPDDTLTRPVEQHLVKSDDQTHEGDKAFCVSPASEMSAFSASSAEDSATAYLSNWTKTSSVRATTKSYATTAAGGSTSSSTVVTVNTSSSSLSSSPSRVRGSGVIALGTAQQQPLLHDFLWNNSSSSSSGGASSEVEMKDRLMAAAAAKTIISSGDAIASQVLSDLPMLPRPPPPDLEMATVSSFQASLLEQPRVGSRAAMLDATKAAISMRAQDDNTVARNALHAEVKPKGDTVTLENELRYIVQEEKLDIELPSGRGQLERCSEGEGEYDNLAVNPEAIPRLTASSRSLDENSAIAMVMMRSLGGSYPSLLKRCQPSCARQRKLMICVIVSVAAVLLVAVLLANLL